MRYEKFRVIVEDRYYRRIIKHTDASSRHRVGGDINQDEKAEAVISEYSEMLAEGKVKRDNLETLGTHLYDLLFDSNISRTFKSEFDRAKREKSVVILRLILEFEPDARKLIEMPWEYIYYPNNRDGGGRGTFLATNSRLVLARYIPLNEEILKELEPDEKPLRILLVIAKPENLGPIKAEPVIAAIEGLAHTFPDSIRVEKLDQPTKRSLKAAVARYQPHALHFIGHGRYDKQRQGGSLALLKEDQKKADWIIDKDFADYFEVDKPRLIFLQTCEGARSNSSYQALRGSALQLVYSGIPAVIAMQYKIENQVANLFAKKFYESLGNGKPIDASVQDGRLELAMFLENENFNSRAFGSPVIFLQNANSIIIADAQTELTHPRTPVVQECPQCLDKLPPGFKINYCLHCGVALMPCPSCKRLIHRDGDCTKCGYQTPLSGRMKTLPPLSSDS
jgi:hypothetical protein